MESRSTKAQNTLGIITQRIGMNQLGCYLNIEGNKLLKLPNAPRLTVFYNELDIIPEPTAFAMMQTAQLRGFDGILVSTDIETTHTMLSIPSAHKKFFYVWNLEWIYTQFMYDYISPAYLNDKVELIARTTQHANVLKRYWKEPTYVIENFSATDLNAFIKKESGKL
jgi:hypothetical protein